MDTPANPILPDGRLDPMALNNLVLALIMRLGGEVTLSVAELYATNNRAFYWNPVDGGLVLSAAQPTEGTA